MQKLFTVVIVGRPNVGKSTLFNCLTQTRTALVADVPGLTRDRLYGQGQVNDHAYLVIDTGGLTAGDEAIESLMLQQTQQAIREADHILLVVDNNLGLLPADQEIAKQLRAAGKPITLVVNKVDTIDKAAYVHDFYALGLGEPIPISAAHRRGLDDLLTTLAKYWAEKPHAATPVMEAVAAIKIAIVGKPNVGKSTLINRLLGEERVVVFDKPGTTRDSVYIDYQRRGKNYVLIDTAGVRRKRSVGEKVEKFSIIKTLQAIEAAHVVILVIDAQQGVTEQDLHLLGFIIEVGKALVIAVNKWDNLVSEQRTQVKRDLERRLRFVDFARIKFISALHGSGVGDLYTLVEEAYNSAMQKLTTPQLTKILEQAVAAHQPPLGKAGRRIKLRYAHPGGNNPPVIVIHGKQTHSLPVAYRRYLSSVYRRELKLVGTPLRIELRDSENPYVKAK